jgi:hypothetical protein
MIFLRTQLNERYFRELNQNGWYFGRHNQERMYVSYKKDDIFGVLSGDGWYFGLLFSNYSKV